MATALLLGVLAGRPPPVVKTSLGSVLGNALHGSDEFLGMLYGDAERFGPAKVRSEPYAAQLAQATSFGPACLQTLTSTENYGVEHGCHVINIWRPTGATAADKLPVLMFVPGGSNDFGEAEPYNASQLASTQRAVIASINYRVGPLGFLFFESEVRRGRGSGNYAQTDVQAALRWLRREVAAFGGDPSRLSIFGHSSAGSLVLLHALMPSSAGLLEGVLSGMLGGWVNPHREQQTIPHGQTSSPPKYFFTPAAKARPDQAALATSAEARGATHRARPRSPRVNPSHFVMKWLTSAHVENLLNRKAN